MDFAAGTRPKTFNNKTALVAAILAVFLLVLPVASSALFPYLFGTSSAALTIQEPLGVVAFPNSLNVNPGQTYNIDVTVANPSTASISVRLSPSLDDQFYQFMYVTFSNATYVVPPGVHDIFLNMTVAANAPANSALNLNVDFYRT